LPLEGRLTLFPLLLELLLELLPDEFELPELLSLLEGVYVLPEDPELFELSFRPEMIVLIVLLNPLPELLLEFLYEVFAFLDNREGEIELFC